MSRYLIVGCSGSGKSTLAREISSITSAPYFDTDSMYWQSGWKLRSDEDVVSKLPLSSSSWVIDGNFVSHRHLVWSSADTIIWLDFPPLLTLTRVTRRNLTWWLRKTHTWSGNRMSLGRAISGIKHTTKQFERFRSDFPRYAEDNPDLNIIRVKTKAGYHDLLDRLKTDLDNKTLHPIPSPPRREPISKFTH